MTYVVDIDDTLLIYPANIRLYQLKYDYANPNEKEIKLLNELFDKGNTIILHTGRNWDKYNYTVKQMKNHNIKYHQLVMGKPQGLYIDKDSYKSLEEALK